MSNLYNGIDLEEYKMNDDEFEKARLVIDKIKEQIFDEEVNTFGLFDIKIGYMDRAGYYALMIDNSGNYQLLDGFPTISESIATMNIVFIATQNQGFEYEYNYRQPLKEMWLEDYPNIPYDGRKYAFEYSLKKLKKISGYVSSNYVNDYLKKLNKRESIWEYDAMNNAFCLK